MMKRHLGAALLCLACGACSQDAPGPETDTSQAGAAVEPQADEMPRFLAKAVELRDRGATVREYIETARQMYEGKEPGVAEPNGLEIHFGEQILLVTNNPLDARAMLRSDPAFIFNPDAALGFFISIENEATDHCFVLALEKWVYDPNTKPIDVVLEAPKDDIDKFLSRPEIAAVLDRKPTRVSILMEKHYVEEQWPPQ